MEFYQCAKFHILTLYGFLRYCGWKLKKKKKNKKQQQQNEELWKWTFIILITFLLSNFWGPQYFDHRCEDGFLIECLLPRKTRIFQMYGSDAGQPVPSLYTKGLSPLCDSANPRVCTFVHTCTNFILIGCCISEGSLHVPIIMYGLQLFTVVLQNYNNNILFTELFTWRC